MTENKNWTAPNAGKMNPQEYFRLLIVEFPSLVKDIQEEDLIHLKMESFAAYTIEQLRTNDFKELERCFDFQESVMDQIDPDLENALEVSYCEALFLSDCADRMDEVIPLMKPKFKDLYQEYFTFFCAED